MAKWWKLGFGKKKGEAPAPEQAPTPPPTPQAPEPSASAGEKKRGLLGRLFGRGKKKKEEAPAPAAPEAPPTAPPAAPPAAPPEGPPEGPAAPAERQFPSQISASADGDWIISTTEWSGHMEGTLRGHKAKEFILAYEAGRWAECAQLVADHWDMNVASQLNADVSNIENISWT